MSLTAMGCQADSFSPSNTFIAIQPCVNAAPARMADATIAASATSELVAPAAFAAFK